MKTHEIMDRTGHTTIEFDEGNAAAIAEANARFRALIGDGYTAATRTKGEHDYDVIRDPNLQRDETLFKARDLGG